MEHTPLETSFTIMESGVPGNTILVVGGIHGDETSGWRAADKLKKVKPKTGTLIVLSPANAPGSRKGERNVELYRDLNRSFPGGKKQDLTDELAASIYQKIIEYSPDLVIDLHEASREGDRRDFLGNSLIITDSENIDGLIFDLLLESQDGSLNTSAPFTCYNGTPKGSLNRTVTETLGIPAITVEVSQEDEPDMRIRNHLAEMCIRDRFGTPDEERTSGKVNFVEAHAFDNIDAVIMCHPCTESEESGTTLGLGALQFEFRGISAHAALPKEDCRNALDALVMSYLNINNLKQYIPGANIYGIIDNGGSRPNIIDVYKRQRQPRKGADLPEAPA